MKYFTFVYMFLFVPHLSFFWCFVIVVFPGYSYLYLYCFKSLRILLSLLASASRLFAIACDFTSGFSSQLFMRIFIRALLLNQTQCSTITVN